MAVFEYAPALDSPDAARLKPAYGLFINGEFAEPADGEVIKSVSPATEEPLAEIAVAGPADVDRAVGAARGAYDRVWRSMPGADRAKYLFRLARVIQERSSELAVLESMTSGTPIKDSRAVDIPLAAAHFFYYAGWADKLRHAGLGHHPGEPAPVGVAGQLIASRLPLLSLARRIAPALACGNTVVLKPAPSTALAALRLAEICQQAGLPPGVVNIVPGGAQAGAALAGHPGVDVVAFTGSRSVGRSVARTLAGTGKRLTLDLGGDAVHIVFDDAPLDEAIDGIADGAFRDQGRACRAGSRLLVQEAVYDEVLGALKRRVSGLRVGDPLDKNTDIGPVSSAESLAALRAVVPAGAQRDGECWSPSAVLPERGYWFAPTIFTEVSEAHRIARAEVFGSVLSVFTFRTPAEAVEKANNTPYGMSAGIWSEKGSRILSVAEKLRTGVVWANTYNKFDPASPFGGYKESGYGREGGRHGLEAYLA